MTRKCLLDFAPEAMAWALVLATQPALAQQSVIDHCRNTSSDTDRIACLEAALLGKELDRPEAPQSQIEPVAAEPVDIGAKQVTASQQTRDERIRQLESARGLPVASYNLVPYQRLVVKLENGQVWRQIKGDAQQIRVDLRRNQTVDITESSLGGYKLRLNEMRRTIRVERVK